MFPRAAARWTPLSDHGLRVSPPCSCRSFSWIAPILQIPGFVTSQDSRSPPNRASGSSRALARLRRQLDPRGDQQDESREAGERDQEQGARDDQAEGAQLADGREDETEDDEP